MLFAYLGSHARMMADDYCHLDVASDHGLLPSVAYWRSNWNGGYTYYLVLGLLSPLGNFAPAMFPALTIAVWLVALTALILQVLSIVQLSRYPRLTAVTAAAVIIAFSIDAFISPQSRYYYAASAKHTLPIAGITAYFALFASVCGQRDAAQSRAQLLAIAGGALCFINAGFGETIALFQLLCIGIVWLASVSFVNRPRNRRCSLFLLVGGLATVASLIVMVTAPGTAVRKSLLDAITSQQSRDIFSVAAVSLETALFHLRDPEVIKGFVAVFALGLYLTLDWPRATPAMKTPPPKIGLARGPLLIALAQQLLGFMMLSQQVSDDPSVLGRYSIGFSIVLVANLAFVVSIAFLLSMPSLSSRILARFRSHSANLAVLFLLAFMLVTALAQIRGVDWRVSTYLYLTFLALLVSLFWQWSNSLPRSATRPAWIAIIAAYAIVFLGSLLITFFGNYIGGSVWPRILTFLPYVSILPALTWATFLGYAIIRLHLSSRIAVGTSVGLKLGSLFVLLVVGVGAFTEQARRIPSFQQYSVEWDTRDQQIKEDRARGLRTVAIAPLVFDLESYVGIDKLHKVGCPLQYYDLDAILIEDS